MTKEMLVLVILFVHQIGAEFKNEINCGLKITNYIVGGTDAQTNEFPFMVSLQNKFSHFCGGSVLNKRWVLTAAHCIKIPVMFGRFTKPSDIQLVIGSTKTNADYIETHRYGVEKWVIHGCFLNTYGDMMTDDITLLKTDRDIPLNGTNIGTICLPKRDANPLELKMLIAGWGVWDPDEESAARKLQKAETTLQSEEFCQTYQWYRNFGIMGWILGKRICLVKKGMTACRGDSGGPAFQTINGRVYQFGIASFISVTIPVDNYCYKENPVMYLKTSVYVDWIQESIEKYTNSFETKIETKC